jgi:hypothetical protein
MARNTRKRVQSFFLHTSPSNDTPPARRETKA